MTLSRDSHARSMDIAFLADQQRRSGNLASARELFEQALDLEMDAIASLETSEGLAWDILHRSAGWLALDCNQPRLAEKLAARALSGEPNAEIARELREVIESANFHRHLEPLGIELQEGEVQLSLAGGLVSQGFTLLQDLITRANSFQAAVFRTVQRMKDLPYRDRVPKDIRNEYRVFASAPRMGSFAISFRLGQPVFQATLPNFLSANDVIREFIDLMEIASIDSEVENIAHRIPDPAYQRNFLGLARNLAPDGNRVSQVGFVVAQGTGPKILSVTKPGSLFPMSTLPDRGDSGMTINVSGMLRYADAGSKNRNRIRLVNADGESHDIEVPSGMMDDIVRPMWNSHVTVKGYRRRKQRIIRLQEIWESEPNSGLTRRNLSLGETPEVLDALRQRLI
ncbi:MAG: hypothetical protein OXR67_01040 [Chloroflexota bacterium]|nr:hypothetical protein [Chloroflexota bacterium]